MKLKTVVLAATLLATCCCALTSYGRAPTGQTKPKKKPAATAGTVATKGSVKFMGSGTLTLNNPNVWSTGTGSITTSGTTQSFNTITLSGTTVNFNGCDLNDSVVFSRDSFSSGAVMTLRPPSWQIDSTSTFPYSTLVFNSGWNSTFNSGSINWNDQAYTADLQTLINYLKPGQGSTSLMTVGGSDSQFFVNELKPGQGTEISDINSSDSGSLSTIDFGLVSASLAFNSTAQPNFIPEPASAILAGCGMAMLLAARRRLQA